MDLKVFLIFLFLNSSLCGIGFFALGMVHEKEKNEMAKEYGELVKEAIDRGYEAGKQHVLDSLATR